jgi:hypothetical protein
MPSPYIQAVSRLAASLKSRTVAGAVAGNITVTGIKKGDKLLIVQQVNAAGAELTSEFTITADNTINNTGGTNTTGMTLLVLWMPRPTEIGYADV